MASEPLCGLPRAAALALFAQSLYYCHAEIYGQLDRLPHWDGLTVQERHGWVQKAADAMEAFRPPQSLFEHVADVARADAARVLAFRDGK